MKLVLLDSLSLLNRAFYALPPLSDEKGRIVNGVYGYMTMLQQLLKTVKPTHVVAAFDVHAPTFRHRMTDTYKATRKPQPPELHAQIPLLKDLLHAMDIATVELEGYEADDIIGTLSYKIPCETIIVTGDRDSLQLVSDTTTVWLTKRGVSDVIEYTPARLAEDGLTPQQIVELKSLMGDSSDNISGVPGVGEKTARDLLSRYGSLDGVYADLDSIKGKLHDKLVDGRDAACLSHTLATICREVPIDIDMDSYSLTYPLPHAARELMEEYGFKKLIAKLQFVQREFEFVTVDDSAKLEDCIRELRSAERLAVYFGEDKISIASSGELSYEIDCKNDFLSPLFFDNVIQSLSGLLNGAKQLVMYNSKADRKRLLRDYGLSISTEICDLSLALYVQNCNNNFDTADDYMKSLGYSGNYASHMLMRFDAVIESIDADENLHRLYYELELPLCNVLLDMETVGFRVDRRVLDELSTKFQAELGELQDRIYTLAGQTFNINSPSQLSDILFTKLGLRSVKKTKTGMSSSQEVLQELVGEHPIVDAVLRYRTISKLQSTYAVGLRAFIGTDGRIHTSFRQNLTTTGRLSSVEPNLQNIPVRTEEGRELRRAFVATEGWTLVAADYSQIELRLLAHFSGDSVLCAAYTQGRDVHRYTAAMVNHVSEERVTAEMRSAAKAVGFGIIYGMSDFGLSKEIGVGVKTASQFIESYFATYPGVRAYMEGLVDSAKTKGYAETILGRRREIAELSATDHNQRAFGERAAKNMPLQGSAADIIKLAMLRVSDRLHSEGLRAKLIMQIHDELIVDTPPDEVTAVERILADCMQNVMSLRVPLTVEVGQGANWLEAK